MSIQVLLAGDPDFRAAVGGALSGEYSLIEVDSVTAAADAVLASRPALAFVDLRGAAAAGLSICKRIKGVDPGQEPLIAALDAGADHVVGFPPSPGELQARLRAALRTRLATDRLEDTSQVIFALANAVEAKDAYTEGHTERVGALAVEAARLAGLDEEAAEALRQGGVLHDIGKIGIPNDIINKAGLLSPKERIVMNKHPLIGERICEPLKSLRSLLPIIRWHHERLDGTGYPDGIKGRAFPVPAQILQLADIYDAITTDRPYHRARTRSSAVEFLLSEAAKGWRDTELVKLLGIAAANLNMGRTREEDIPPPPAPMGQWRTE